MRRLLMVGLAVAMLGGCANDATGGDSPDAAAYMRIGPRTDTIPRGGSIQLSATTYNCAVDGLPPVGWRTLNSDVATVFGNGLVTGVAKGSALITATFDCTKDSRHPQVLADTNFTVVDTLHINSAQATPGSAPVKMTASVAGAASTNSAYVWSTNNKSIATITTDGTATAVSPGMALITVMQTVSGTTNTLSTGSFYVTGPGTCSLKPTGLVGKANLHVTVQSDPGGHASQIALPSTLPFTTFDFGGTMFNSQINVASVAPLVGTSGGWLGADCAFVTNGTGDIGGSKNVGVRLEGTWTSGSLNLKYTVGTNGELSGGATVYTIAG